jgi:hypothetical protein
MSLKRFAALLGISIVAVLTLYFGVRFINAVFNSAEKQVATTTTQPKTTNWTCMEEFPGGDKVFYEDMVTCHKRAAAGGKVITFSQRPGLTTKP